MKILWITNIMLPPICEKINTAIPKNEGWLYSSLQSLKLEKSIKLAVATVYNGSDMKKYEIEGIIYYLLPLQGINSKYHKELEVLWKKVNEDFNPDIVHLHGTEYAHGLAFLRACPHSNSIVSIQGLISVISRYYLGGISLKEVRKSITLHDVFKMSMIQEQKAFMLRGENEKSIIRLTKNLIGRTSWDRAHTWAINPKAHYHFCNETLRTSFYNYKWDYNDCEPYSIFISQAWYPVKGFHILLRALPIVLRFYPNTKVYVAGGNIINGSSFIKKIKMRGYGRYIKNLIRDLGLTSNVIFTGALNEKEMCQRYLQSNLFVCPSSIENSPNSLGEAQLLGMPCIASYVGGIPDMMQGCEEYMYRYDDVEMLAEKICKVFKCPDFNKFKEMRIKALQRHDKDNNTRDLINIYQKVLLDSSF